jgi:hypothetical protein
LPLKKGYLQQIANSLKNEITPEILLFLNKLQEITIGIECFLIAYNLEIPNAPPRAVIRDPQSDNLTAKITTIKLNNEIFRYWTCAQDSPIPPNTAYGPRAELTKRIISIAFPLDSNPSPSHPNVFAYLPTNINNGFPFYLNADFILNASREGTQQTQPLSHFCRDKRCFKGYLEQMAYELDTRIIFRGLSIFIGELQRET